MMMIERAARAIAIEHGTDPDREGRPGHRHAIPREDGLMAIVTDHMGPLWTMWIGDARAALLAALDPEDETLVERVGFEIADELNGLFDEAQAKRIIATLRSLAQEQAK